MTKENALHNLWTNCQGKAMVEEYKTLSDTFTTLDIIIKLKVDIDLLLKSTCSFEYNRNMPADRYLSDYNYVMLKKGITYADRN